MLQLLVIGCGGAVGALMRYGLALRITSLAGSAFPWGILFVNIVGCFQQVCCSHGLYHVFL